MLLFRDDSEISVCGRVRSDLQVGSVFSAASLHLAWRWRTLQHFVEFLVS
eukprot:m.1219175 g.1219175  ORF g.1219175 m.1219175 type:complete len:50 (+) comp24620_c0_seq26:6043-6192(+)